MVPADPPPGPDVQMGGIDQGWGTSPLILDTLVGR